MSVTYTVTETSGHVHTRTSARHLRPLYPFAVVRAPGCVKALVSFHGSLELAQAALRKALAETYADNWFARERGHTPGAHVYPDAKLYPTVSTVKGKRAADAA